MRGVIVGCDQKQEWMLPWWYEHFRKHNDLPVAFIDFGMTHHAKKWCSAHGALIPLKAPTGFVYPQIKIPKELRVKWEKRYVTHVWSARGSWFNKPFALLQSPFKETIWLDLDCEILGSIKHLYQKLHKHSRIALVRDNTGPFEDVGYNSGVVVYDSTTPLLTYWAAACIRQNNHFLGDQEILTDLIQNADIEVAELPEKYNWVVNGGIHPEAVVLHWSGSWGKQMIRNRVSSGEKVAAQG